MLAGSQVGLRVAGHAPKFEPSAKLPMRLLGKLENAGWVGLDQAGRDHYNDNTSNSQNTRDVWWAHRPGAKKGL